MPDDAVALPDVVRARVVALAAEQIPKLAAADLPAPLRTVATFTPGRRAKLGAPAITAAIESDVAFRLAVGAAARAAHPDIAAALDAGDPPPGAPGDVAAVAYLLRPDGWQDVVARATEQLGAAGERARLAAGAAASERLAADLAAERTARKHERDALRAETEALRTEIASLRRSVRAAQDAQRRAELATRDAEAALATAREEAAAALAEAKARQRRQSARLAEMEAQLDSARRAGREARAYDDTRVWLLLDTLLSAAQGLKRELAVAPPDERPGDRVHAMSAEAAGPASGQRRGLEAADPAWLDSLLRLPRVHLIVDGYNVSKTAYGDLPLEAQRSRLVTGLKALAARTQAEVTVVFDGAAVTTAVHGLSTSAVRVHFSPPGRIADEEIRAFAAAEPPGRAVVVVSSDREVAEAARRYGAHPVPSPALVALLDRG